MKIDLEKAKKNIACAKSYWSDKHNDFQTALAFVNSDKLEDSWDTRVDPNRVQAHFKLVKRYVNKLMEGVRQNAPGIKLTPVDSTGDSPLAGAVRYIENKSQARIAYPKALEYALICGLGWLKITHDEKKNPEVQIKVVRDMSSAFFDPESTEIDGSDGEYCFITSSKKDEEGKPQEIIQYYEINDKHCYWAHIEKGEIVDQGQFILDCLPLIPVYGSFHVNAGEKVFTGLSGDLKAVNQFFDYTVSTSVETVAAQTKDPLFVFEGQADLEKIADAATKPIPVIEIKAANAANEPFPGVPFRIQRNFNIEWLTAATAIFNKLFGDITGIADQSFGVDGANIQSGYAVEMRQKTNSNLLHSEYIDNLYASISYLGQQLAVYAANEIAKNAKYMAMHPDGTVIRHNGGIQFDINNLEVYGSVGKSYLNKNQEFFDKFRELLPTMPPDMLALCMDVFWRSTDTPYGDILAQRAYSMLPSAARTDGSVSMQEFQALQQQLQQAQQQNAVLMDQERVRGQNALTQAQVEGQTKLASIEAKKSADMDIMMLKRDIDTEKDERKHEYDTQLAAIKGEFNTAMNNNKLDADALARVQKLQAEVEKQTREEIAKAQSENRKANIDMAKIKTDLAIATAKIAAKGGVL